jgi:hypothetical protein
MVAGAGHLQRGSEEGRTARSMAQIELIYQVHRQAGSTRAKIPKIWTNETCRRMMTEL